MIEYAPGMRLIIRDEEWMIKKIDTNEIGAKALTCIGISPLVKDKEAIFLDDLEKIDPVDPTKVKLVKDESPKYTKSLLYLESQWRQKNPTDKNIHIGHKAAMDLELIPKLSKKWYNNKKPKRKIDRGRETKWKIVDNIR